MLLFYSSTSRKNMFRGLLGRSCPDIYSMDYSGCQTFPFACIKTKEMPSPNCMDYPSTRVRLPNIPFRLHRDQRDAQPVGLDGLTHLDVISLVSRFIHRDRDRLRPFAAALAPLVLEQ